VELHEGLLQTDHVVPLQEQQRPLEEGLDIVAVAQRGSAGNPVLVETQLAAEPI
jgi:hypothetical protein